MRKIFLSIFCCIIALSCDTRTQVNNKKLYPLSSQPLSQLLDLESGYPTNKLNGKPIKPLISIHKDTIQSGKYFPLKYSKLQITPRKLPSNSYKQIKGNIFAKRRLISKPKAYHIKGEIYHPPNKYIALDNKLINRSNLINTTKLKGKKMSISMDSFIPSEIPYFKEGLSHDMQNYSIQQGLQSPVVYDICSDLKGGFWIAGRKGISHYDGTFFTQYMSNKGLPAGNIRSILEDSKGNIWFYPKWYGLCKYDGDSLTVFTEKSGLMSNQVYNIKEDHKGNIWWGSVYGLTKYDGETATHYYLGKEKYTRLCIDHKGDIWTFAGQKVLRFNGENWINYDLKENDLELDVSTIFEDSNKHIWFSFKNGGILEYNGKHFLQYTTKQGLPTNSISSITQGQNNTLLLGSDTGLIEFTSESFVNYTTKDGLTSNLITKVILDNKKNIWLGTIDRGIIKCNPKNSALAILQNTIGNSSIVGFVEDEHQGVWLLNRDAQLVKFKSNNPLYITSLNKKVAQAITRDTEGDFWVGVKGGVIKYSLNEKVFYPIIHPNHYVLTLSTDNQGNIWIGSQDPTRGLIKYDGKGFIKYKLPTKAYVRKILKDKKNNIWLGTPSGLYQLKNKKWILYTEKEGLSSSNISDLLEDDMGNIWIGTSDQGLMKFSQKKVLYYTQKQGLISNSIKSLIKGPYGNIWLGTKKGISCLSSKFSPNFNDQNSPQIINCDVFNRPIKTELEFRSIYLDKKNTLWLGGFNTILNLDLNSFSVSTDIPEVRLRQVKINERSLNFRKLPDNLRKYIKFKRVSKFTNYPIKPSLHYTHNHLKFYFAAMGIHNSQNTVYSYKIKEIEKSWSSPSNQNFAEYRSLPYGTYTFQVKASYNSQIWSEIVEYVFCIHPPWWKSRWFKVLYMLSGSLLIVLYIKWRMSKSVKRQRFLEDTVKQRTQDLHNAILELNKLNINLKQSKKEVILLKEKETKMLSNHIKERESELLLVMELIGKKLDKINIIKDGMLVAIKRNNRDSLLSSVQTLSAFLDQDNSLNVLEERITSKYPDLMLQLKLKYPKLSKNDLRHCLYVKLDLSLKQSAYLLNVSVHAVKMARNRLKKKMDIPAITSLKEFIETLL